jgi:hypothetical protein
MLTPVTNATVETTSSATSVTPALISTLVVAAAAKPHEQHDR